MKCFARYSRRNLLLPLALSTLIISSAAHSEVIENQDFRRLATPQPVAAPARIEVIEFFSHGCESCYQFHPMITRWSATLPDDAAFIRIPFSIGRPKWAALVRAYYALQASGDLERLDLALFEAIHKEKQPLFDEGAITAWVARQGVDPNTFGRAYSSKAVRDLAQRAEEMGRDYAIIGIPTLIVNGQFSVRGPRVRSYDDILRVATELVDRARHAPTAPGN